MRSVQVRVSRAVIADTMATMRDWLDRHQMTTIGFGTASDDDGVMIILEFASADTADAFQREFGGR